MSVFSLFLPLSGEPQSPGNTHTRTHTHMHTHTYTPNFGPPMTPLHVPHPPPDAQPLEVRALASVSVCVCVYVCSPPAKADTPSPQLPFSSARPLLEYSRFRLFSLRERERETEYKNMQMLLLKRRTKGGGWGAPFTPPHLPAAAAATLVAASASIHPLHGERVREREREGFRSDQGERGRDNRGRILKIC